MNQFPTSNTAIEKISSIPAVHARQRQTIISNPHCYTAKSGGAGWQPAPGDHSQPICSADSTALCTLLRPVIAGLQLLHGHPWPSQFTREPTSHDSVLHQPCPPIPLPSLSCFMSLLHPAAALDPSQQCHLRSPVLSPPAVSSSLPYFGACIQGVHGFPGS